MSIDRGTRLVPADHPELKMLAWSRDPMRPIPAEEAFALYERNWRFVDTNNLTEPERKLIDDLTQKFGRGIMLTASG